MGKYEPKGRKKAEVPEEATGQVKDLLSVDVSGRWFGFAEYDDKTLREAVDILEKYDIRKTLRHEIEKEIKLREDIRGEKVPSSNSAWLPPYWNAVMTLFGKGTWKRSDEKTKEYLDKIKPEWKNNCNGG